MSQRHNNALGFQQGGACVLRVITHSLQAAMLEVHNEGGNVRKDSACRLMVHQMCNLFGMNVDDVSGTHPVSFVYDDAFQDCIDHADAHTLTRLNLLHRRKFVARAPREFPPATTPLDIPSKPLAA